MLKSNINHSNNNGLASKQAGAGSLQLVVIGLLAALLVVLAVPIFAGFVNSEHKADFSQN